VAGFSLGPMILLLAGAFSAPLAVPLGLVGAAVAMWVCGVPAERTTQRTVLFTVAAALVTLAWFVYNVRYYAQDVYATRDPATYGIAARWLMDHSSLNIPVHTEVFGTPSGSTLDASGFQVARLGILHAQGNHLLPALMSLAGSTFGTTALLQANVAIGALALFVFFGLARAHRRRAAGAVGDDVPGRVDAVCVRQPRRLLRAADDAVPAGWPGVAAPRDHLGARRGLRVGRVRGGLLGDGPDRQLRCAARRGFRCDRCRGDRRRRPAPPRPRCGPLR